MAAPSLVAGDFIGGPGTGTLGGPPIQHNYKRAVVRPAPAHFTVEVLPPAKFGSGFCYGMRICPILGSELPDNQSAKSGKSSKSGNSMHTEYEVWRRWEDCLWFQDLLESEYGLMARTKRQRLAAGKGVKKNGVYIHSDQAASFESLPPGPEASSIAKDIHDIVPKLTKKGTIFRASQSTVDQRGKEFRAMIDTLYSDEVPTLIKELRDTPVVRDFFGYWRRDKDHDKKTNPQPEANGGDARNSVAGSTTSMYFSASNISVQIPNSPAKAGASPSPHPSRRAAGKSPGGKYARSDSTASSSSASSVSPLPRSPENGSSPMQFSVTNRGSLAIPSPGSEDESRSDYVGSHRSASLSSTSSLWLNRTPSKSHSTKDSGTQVGIEEVPFMLMSDGQSWPDKDHRGLQALPEDQELVPVMSHMSLGAEPMRPPVRRMRNNSCPDRTNRNCVVFVPPGNAASESDHPTTAPAQVDGDSHQFSLGESPGSPTPPNTEIGSSRPSSIAMSTYSEYSTASSWRTSIASEMSVATGISSFRDSYSYSDDRTFSSQLSDYTAPHPARASILTINSIMSGSSVDAVLPRKWSPPPSNGSLRRSLSAGSHHAPSLSNIPIPTEEVWDGHQDDFIDAYFYDPTLRSSSPVESVYSSAHESVYSSARESAYSSAREDLPKNFNAQMSVPERFPKPFQDRPPGQFHLPWSTSEPPTSPTSSVAPSLASQAGPDTFTVKVMLDDSIVLLRATYSTSFLEIRERIREKFAKHEGVRLPESFVIAYIPSGDRARLARGRTRSNSTSTLSGDTSQPLRYIASDEEWQTAISSSAAKLTIRVFNLRS